MPQTHFGSLDPALHTGVALIPTVYACDIYGIIPYGSEAEKVNHRVVLGGMVVLRYPVEIQK